MDMDLLAIGLENLGDIFIWFGDKIFNALVDRIEILESTHFVFILKNGMRVEENIVENYRD